LDGQGADELFGGYPGMLGHHLGDILLSQGFDAWRAAVLAFSRDGADLDAGALKRATFNAIVPEQARRTLAKLRGRWPQSTQVTRGEMSYGPARLQGLGRFESLMRTLQDQASLPSLLRYEDRNAMTFGIETRLPFLSSEMVDLAARIPGNIKARAGWTKAVLRDAAIDFVPELVVRRRKKLGFITPQDRWMAGPIQSWCREGTNLAVKYIPDLLDKVAVANVFTNIGVDAAINGVGFRLACFGHWAERNKIS
jgi:asparagine synthase (glutamine-hydrolysing)